MKYNFDEVIDRRNTNSMKISGYNEYLFPTLDNVKYPVPDEELVQMWIADMEFATPDVVIDAMKDRLDKRIFGYTKIFDENYYNFFAQWTRKKYGWECKKEHLVTSPGIIPALYELIGLICKENDKVLFTTPSYAFFDKAAIFNNKESIYSPLKLAENGEYSLDFDDLAKKAKDAKVLIFCNPHNPTGVIWTEEELKKVAAIAEENDLWLISDEIHCDLIRSDQSHIPLAKVSDYDKIITTMSPSKTFNLAGLMLSNIIIPNKDLMAAWQAHHFAFENPLSVAAIQAAYEKGEEWLSELQAYLDENFNFLKEFLDENLPETNFHIPAATYLAWIDVSAYVPKDVDLTLWFAQESGVLLESGTQFVANGDGFIRLNLACPKAMLQDCLEKVTGLLKK